MLEKIQTWDWIDKSGWGAGAWFSEHDKYSWTDPDTDLPCLIVRGPIGALCGYVGVAEHHPLFGVDEIEFVGEFDREITFTNFCDEEHKERGICHIPEPGKPDQVWWLGFACGEFGDLIPDLTKDTVALCKEMGHTYKPVEYVKAQVKLLALQLHSLR